MAFRSPEPSLPFKRTAQLQKNRRLLPALRGGKSRTQIEQHVAAQEQPCTAADPSWFHPQQLEMDPKG
ncbi:hypothetical protein Y1Q_0011485 [Alligator mississippiensis]|uniref:Uncharacterized protein n=1 Tax=Alligator mississippiensis TaxID=8496 RepID=A0A151LZW2_ALLMI|nr:hypothetical protein Y1Q_0011485 [Alligator mississippiensis]